MPILMPQGEDRPPAPTEAPRPKGQITTLHWGLAFYCAFMGSLMVVAPHQFSNALFAGMRPHLPEIGFIYFLLGMALIGTVVAGAPRRWVVAAHLAASAAPFAYVYSFLVVGLWQGVFINLALGLTMALTPYVTRLERPDRPDSGYLFPVVLGAFNVTSGLLILLLPEQSLIPVYDPVSRYLPLYGAALAVTGAALIFVQFHSGLPAWLYRAAHLSILPPAFAYGVSMSIPLGALAYADTMSIPLGTWAGILTNCVFPPLVASLPWTGSHLRSIDPRSFSVRLAFLLALTAIVPFVVTVGFVTSNLARAERDIAFGLLLSAVLVAVVVATLMARRLTSPLHELSWATSKLTRGDSAAELPRGGSSEIEGLVSNFGAMREALAARTAERERLLADVQRRSAEMDAIFSSMVVGLAMYDATGRMVMMNPAGERMSGYTEEDRSLPIAERVSVLRAESPEGNTLRAEETPVSRALRGETVESATMLVHLRDGRNFWMWVSAAPIMDGRGQLLGAVATFADVTAQRQAEAEHEARVQAERLARARDEYIAVAAHEIKTPLTSLKGFAQMLLRQLERNGDVNMERLTKAAEVAWSESERLSGLAERLVNASELESGDLRLMRSPTDLSALAEKVVSKAGRLHPKRSIQLHTDGAVRASVDPTRLAQVLASLIDNAVKFSPPQSPVEVRVGTDVGRGVRISVRDYGSGVPQGERERIFERHYRALPDRHFGGMGLGLYVGKRIVEMHGGSIAVEHPEGEGSRFTIHIPSGGEH